jgi:general secretion pathway protein D
MKRITLLLAMILAACCSAMPLTGSAADSSSTPSVSESSPRNLRDVDLRALIREVGVREHKHILWDPRLPQMVEIGNLERQEFTYPRLLALLRIIGFAVVAKDGMLEIVPDANLRFEAFPVVSPDNIKALDDEEVTTILPLKGMSAVQLVTILRPLVPPNGQINALSERNAIIIVDRSDNVRRIVEIARTLEKLPVPAASAPERTPGQ